jgi:tetratricopeptide (TPR) repeat protein
VLILFVASVITNRFSRALGIKRQFGGGVSVYVPVRALDFARDAGVGGRPFNCMVMGGFMAWRLFPGQRVFVDGRIETYPEPFFATYFRGLDDPQTWPSLAAAFGFDYALLDHTSVDRWPLARYLASGHGWTLAYYDEIAALFLPLDEAHRPMRERAERAFRDIEARRLQEPLAAAPGRLRRTLAFPLEDLQIQIGYGDFLRFIGRNLEAVRAYQQALVLDPDSPDVRLALGGAYWFAGSREQAMEEWREILRRDPGFEGARKALAQASGR